MEATVLSVSKSVLSAALSYAKSALAQEVALQLSVQRDQAFITDELEMMRAFLMAAHDEQDGDMVVNIWVKQVRDVSYDAEDCLQEFAVRLLKPSWWRIPRTLLDRRRVAKQMKDLRAKVDDVSQRNVRYQLIKGSGSKSTVVAEQSSRNASATMFGIEAARRAAKEDNPKSDLVQLIDKEDKDLRVIAVWGTSGDLGLTSTIKRAYDDPKIHEKFKCRAWIRLVHPFNPTEFLHSIMRQFYANSSLEIGKIQEKEPLGAHVLQKMGKMKQEDYVKEFSEYVNEKSYLIVLNDLWTIEDWDWIKTYFPNNKNGSRIIVATKKVEVASLCTGQECQISELKQLSTEQTLYVFNEKGYQDGIHAIKPGSSSNAATSTTDDSTVPSNEILEDRSKDATGNNALGKSLTRVRTMAAVLEESHLVGRKKEKLDIVNLAINQASQQFEVISVWGMGGLGKTTLVRDVYQSQELSGKFEKRAFVMVMRPLILEELLRGLVLQLDVETKEKDVMVWLGSTKKTLLRLAELTTELARLLKAKRCLIVIDDLSCTAEWDLIMKEFPEMEDTSRIIVTTREESVAKHCSSAKQEDIYQLKVLEDQHAHDLLVKKVFKKTIDLKEQCPELVEQSELISRKCSGLPLAIVTIGGFLANQPKTVVEWRKLNERISAELEMNPELKAINMVLIKSYDGLPYHLKSCFLYMSIFPEDHKIRRRRLVCRWTAEGYSREVHNTSAEEMADSYFMELISRSMILPSQLSIYSRKQIDSCQVHDLIREIGISKSTQENLVYRLEEGCSLNSHGTTRHLAISSKWEGDQVEFESIVDMSRVRSLTVFGKWRQFFISRKMRLLRVLDLEGTSGHLEHIGELLHLRYLSLRGCDDISCLPDSLGNLRQLQILDVKEITVFGINKRNGKEFCSALASLNRLESLLVQSLGNPGLSGCLGGLTSPPENLQSLKLYGNLVKLPEWIQGLKNLVKLKLRSSRIVEHNAAIQLLGKLPNLEILLLQTESFEGEEVRLKFHREAFPSLMVMELVGLKDKLMAVEFEVGATLKLELLRFRGWPSNTNVGLFAGLQSLISLKEFTLDDDDYKEDFMEDLRVQLAQNQNSPALKKYDW